MNLKTILANIFPGLVNSRKKVDTYQNLTKGSAVKGLINSKTTLAFYVVNESSYPYVHNFGRTLNDNVNKENTIGELFTGTKKGNIIHFYQDELATFDSEIENLNWLTNPEHKDINPVLKLATEANQESVRVGMLRHLVTKYKLLDKSEYFNKSRFDSIIGNDTNYLCVPIYNEEGIVGLYCEDERLQSGLTVAKSLYNINNILYYN